MGGSPLDSHEKGKWPKIVRQLQGWKNTHNFPSPSFESDGGGTLIFGPPKTPLKKTGVYSGPWEMERFFVCLFFLKIGLSVGGSINETSCRRIGEIIDSCQSLPRIATPQRWCSFCWESRESDTQFQLQRERTSDWKQVHTSGSFF